MRTALVTAVAGAVVAFLLGLLTFGVQATAHPHDVPLAVVAPPPIAERVTAADSAEVDIRVVSAGEAGILLADKEVYGVLEITPGQATIRLNPAVNPSGTQVAQQVLTGVAQGAGLPVTIETRAVTAAERTAPLAASALLWVGGMVAGLLFVVLKGRSLRWLSALAAAVLVAGSTTGLLTWWGVTFNATALAFLLAVAVSFALLQAGLFKHLGLRAMGVLGLLYLMAPAVAGQVRTARPGVQSGPVVVDAVPVLDRRPARPHVRRVDHHRVVRVRRDRARRDRAAASRQGSSAGPSGRGCRRWCRPGRRTARCRAPHTA